MSASKHRAAAAAYLKMLLGKRAQATFRAYGFLPRRHTGMRRVAFFAVVFAATLADARFPRPPDRRDLHARLAGDARSQLANPVVDDALHRQREDDARSRRRSCSSLGTPTAYLLATRRFRGRSLVVTPSSCRSCCRPRSRASACWSRSAAWAAAHVDPVHADGGDARGRVRLRPALRARGDRCLRGGRPDARRRRPHARCRSRSHVLPRRVAARGRRPRRGRGSRVRTRPRRVRRDDHVRRARCSASRRRCRSRSTPSST